ncbi:hypothetical protein SGQ44_06065 [Flavobacterium sp. Fl-77]|uniref:Uncharacterized protein n=1 Tax=Flavobacterium flavipigmentatum TaxID=2893884 RepID=A0AAJ2S6B4_9FLAO|nr:MULTISPECIES: hypothetical protein [unclassified Flavobacterium]MDX6181653.1 hypothetical protein [Flavobacterium sp. Fl-33]MDX6185313.1 hypothetical protein [Flavobacterium sp. Fl-77]UFH37418.1 hypothetical protein LNP22_11795 [Flavobacterium sp. F-70]
MRITLISLDNWGFNNHIAITLKQKGHIVHHINFNKYEYKYPNFLYRIYNFGLKTFFKKNLKTIYFGKKIIEDLTEINQIQDLILVIKGDFIDPKSVLELKKFGKKTVAYFNDNTNRCPKIIRVIPNFDEVFSFEKEDCKKYNLKFATNWIYNSVSVVAPKPFEYQVFNIISKDKRLSILSKIADNLKSNNISHKIFVYDKKYRKKTSTIEFITNHIPLAEIKEYINRSQVLLDINRKSQSGLTFRVFESMGLQKKLITTNADIVNYDFYNPNNILVINEKNPIIPVSFFEKEYEKLPDAIFNKYTLEGWIDIVVYNTLR